VCVCPSVRWQTTSDLAALKRLQEQQNETMYLVEELMMSNAVEIISHNKHAVAVRHEIAQLQAEASNDRRRIRELDDQLQQHVAAHDRQHATGNGRQWGLYLRRVCRSFSYDECDCEACLLSSGLFGMFGNCPARFVFRHTLALRVNRA